MSIDKYFAAKDGAYDKNNLVACMAEYGDTKTPFYGKNEDGETVCVSVYKDSIEIDTYQSNGYVRRNHFNAYGVSDGESYEGRWDR